MVKTVEIATKPVATAKIVFVRRESLRTRIRIIEKAAV
jgi:hypothetical protein